MPVRGRNPKGLGKLLIKSSWWARKTPALPTERTDPGKDTPKGSDGSRVTPGQKNQHQPCQPAPGQPRKRLTDGSVREVLRGMR